eukprot:6088359-Prymnesium_polylepis.3
MVATITAAVLSKRAAASAPTPGAQTGSFILSPDSSHVSLRSSQRALLSVWTWPAWKRCRRKWQTTRDDSKTEVSATSAGTSLRASTYRPWAGAGGQSRDRHAEAKSANPHQPSPFRRTGLRRAVDGTHIGKCMLLGRRERHRREDQLERMHGGRESHERTEEPEL